MTFKAAEEYRISLLKVAPQTRRDDFPLRILKAGTAAFIAGLAPEKQNKPARAMI